MCGRRAQGSGNDRINSVHQQWRSSSGTQEQQQYQRVRSSSSLEHARTRTWKFSGARSTTNSGVEQHGSKGKMRGIGRGAHHSGTRSLWWLRSCRGDGSTKNNGDDRGRRWCRSGRCGGSGLELVGEEDEAEDGGSAGPPSSAWGRRWPRGRRQQRRRRRSGVGRNWRGERLGEGEWMRMGVRPGRNRGARGALSSRRWRTGHDAGSGGDEREPLSVGRTGEERETTWGGLGRSVQLGCLGLLGQGAQGVLFFSFRLFSF